jgi:hypothetical protein
VKRFVSDMLNLQPFPWFTVTNVLGIKSNYNFKVQRFSPITYATTLEQINVALDF